MASHSTWRMLGSMRSPFRSEPAAFHFLLLTVAAFAVVAIASTLAAAYVYLRHGRSEALEPIALTTGGGPERHILVVAHEALTGEALHTAIRQASSGRRADVLVVCPPTVSATHLLASDVDAERAEAQRRLAESLEDLRHEGLEVRGLVGDENPLLAIEDALVTFPADEIILALHPVETADRAEQGLLTRVRERIALPVTQVVVKRGEQPVLSP